VAGDGPDRGRLERLARHYGVRERVRFLGILDDRSLLEAYRACEARISSPQCGGIWDCEPGGRRLWKAGAGRK
jgi:hypothetical protein